MVMSMRRTSGCAVIGADCVAGVPAARPWRRSRAYCIACWVAVSAMATPCRPTASRASFIMVNMHAMPRFSSPMRKPVAPPASPNTMVQVGDAWMPSLCSIECARTSLR